MGSPEYGGRREKGVEEDGGIGVLDDTDVLIQRFCLEGSAVRYENAASRTRRDSPSRERSSKRAAGGSGGLVLDRAEPGFALRAGER
jgi:hypothetical protein